MTDISYPQELNSTSKSRIALSTLRLPISLLLALLATGVAVWLGMNYHGLADDAPLFAESTPGQLAVWMADQSAEEAPESFLGNYAKNWAQQTNAESVDPVILFDAMRNGVALWCWLVAALIVIGVIGLLMQAAWSRSVLIAALIALDGLLFVFPVLAGDATVGWLIAGIVLLMGVLLLSAGDVSKVMGFVVALSVLLVAWQSIKGFAASVDYSIRLPTADWSYDVYPDLDGALEALEAGEVNVVMADQRELRDIIPALSDPADISADTVRYPDLRILDRLETEAYVMGLAVAPEFSGRLAVVVRADGAESWQQIADFMSEKVGARANDFAVARYLAVPREIVVLDLKIFNDLNLPHLQSIANAFLQPARRNGPLLLARILADAGLYTWGEALSGFISGATLGFVLGALFAHSPLMERGLLPYVVASQTVPILAIAPMVVIWLGAGPQAVAVIAAYITFFPVTINTLRGLRSPSPMALELMESYAASKLSILMKLRIPAALPYIFTALKVSATASVVGAIIGELPSSIRDGLGRAILDFSSDYSLISTPKLWASIITAAFVGISFFVIVSVIERIVLGRYVRST